jgi:hypothetical protein
VSLPHAPPTVKNSIATVVDRQRGLSRGIFVQRQVTAPHVVEVDKPHSQYRVPLGLRSTSDRVLLVNCVADRIDGEHCNRDQKSTMPGAKQESPAMTLMPEPRTGEDSARASVRKYGWRPHCRGLYQTPIAA